MKPDNLELLNFTKSQIFEKQRYNIVENIILYNMKYLKLFEIWKSKKQLAKQMTFWSIWKKKTLSTTDPFSVTYLMKSHVSYWKQKWIFLSQQDLISHILL